jgi:transcriptional regulator with XRE-family HTH domain
MNLSRRIRDLRYAKGWGPDELASRAKISRTALYQIERGNTSKPQAGTLRRISRALGVPLEILLETPFVSTDGDSVALPNVSTPGPASSMVPGRVFFIRSGGGTIGKVPADPCLSAG